MGKVDWEALEELAKKTDSSVQEICELAKLIVLSQYDPIPPRELGEVFDFKDHRKIALFPKDDFGWINEDVPLPNADVDLFVALREVERDFENMREVLSLSRSSSRRLSLQTLCRIVCVTFDWQRFWAQRHPNPETRRKYADACDESLVMGSELLWKMAEAAGFAKDGIIPDVEDPDPEGQSSH
jgi:hypothetical protein